jgi:hypothetical protein
MSVSSAWGKPTGIAYTGSLVTMCPACEKLKHWTEYKFHDFTWNNLCCDETCYALWLLRKS